MSRAHGIPSRFDDDAWISLRRSPPMYPDAVTLSTDVSVTSLLARIDDSAGCSVKDSFAVLDLSSAGFTVLFEASWIYLPADVPVPDANGVLSWSVVSDYDDLPQWGMAHGGGDVFVPALLADPTVTVFAVRRDGRLVAGAVANLSDSAVGLSNIFTVPGQDPDEVWTCCAAAFGQHFAGSPIVGYEAGESLAAAQRAGFTECGPLRVWVKG